LLRGLRGAPRTEPNVRLAVLFGLTATGGDNQSSDVDVLVALGDPVIGRLSELSERCSCALGRELHLVGLAEAEESPALMLGVRGKRPDPRRS
jgi:predicted nucleotidyltransferase